MIENLWTTHNVSIIGCSQSVLSTQTLEFEAILDQQVQAQTPDLAVDYEQLGAMSIELRRLIMKMRSQMGGTCAPSYLLHGPDEDPSPLPLVSLF